MEAIDVHVHLVGLGTGSSGCHVSPRMQRTLVYKILRRFVGFDPDDPAADDLYASRVADLVRRAEHVGRAVALALDGVYDRTGRFEPDRSHLYVPNDHLFAACRTHPELLPGVSVNPTRRDALDELERCAALGAVLMKWLPPLQLFDPAAPECRPFYRALARLGLPLLAHTGCEHSFPDMVQDLAHPGRYLGALEEGVTVVFAHSGVSCPLHRGHDTYGEILALMDRFPNLHADTSALTSLLKFHRLSKIPFDRYPGRFLHGSDYPIPSLAFPFVRKLGIGGAIRLTLSGNSIESDCRIKAAVGVPEDVFTAAAKLLAPRIERWEAARRGPAA